MIITPKTIPASPIGERWAIVVGISRYRHTNLNLAYADRDAREFYAFIQSAEGGGFKRENVVFLVNETATTENVTRALRTFLKKPDRADLVIIYFACHGSSDPDRPSNVYLLTHDVDPADIAGTALPMREIDLSLRENLHAEKVVIIADTCHSAAIGGGPGTRRSVSGAGAVNAYLRDLSATRSGVALLTSAEADEVSFEGAQWGGGHGVFTHYLLEGMRGAADVAPKNGLVTVGELFEYVRENVKLATEHRQHPAIGTTTFDRGLPMAIPGLEVATSEHAAEATPEIHVDDGVAAASRTLASGVLLRRVRRPSRAIVFATAGLIAVLLVMVAAVWHRDRPTAKSLGTIQVLEFLSVGAPQTGQEKLGPWLQEKLTGTLADSGWRAVGAGGLQGRAVERGIANIGAADSSRAGRGADIRATHVIGGTYQMVAADTIAIDAYVVETASGRVVSARNVRAAVAKVGQGILDLAGDVLRGTVLESASNSGVEPSGRAAAVSGYVNGLLLLNRNQVAQARELFRGAVRSDSTYIPSASALRVVESFTRDPRPAIAVGAFTNAGMPIPRDSALDLSQLESGLPDLLISELMTDANVVVVDRMHVQELLREQAVPAPNPRTSARIQKLRAARYWVSGSYMLLGSTWDLDVQLHDLASGALIQHLSSKAPCDSLFTAIGRIGIRLVAAVSTLPPAGADSTLDSLRRFRARIGLSDSTPAIRR